MVVLLIHLFVHDDSLTSLRFTMRTEQLTTCCEPLRKMRVRLGSCKTDLSPHSTFITDRSKAILLVWFYMFYGLESIFVLFEPCVRLHSFIR